MIRFQVQITIDGDQSQLEYHGQKLDKEELQRLIAELVYNHTAAYENEITVSAVALKEYE